MSRKEITSQMQEKLNKKHVLSVIFNERGFAAQIQMHVLVKICYIYMQRMPNIRDTVCVCVFKNNI